MTSIRPIVAVALVGAACLAQAHAAPAQYRLVNLGVLPSQLEEGVADSFANGINRHGVVVGDSDVGEDFDDFTVPVLVAPGSAMVRIPMPADDWGSAFDVNAHGVVVGSTNVESGDERAFAYDAGTGVTTILPTLGGAQSAAWAVNDAGQVVGYSDTADGGVAFLYDITTGVISPVLPDNDVPSEAWDINGIGQVVGNRNTETGYEPFLFTPGSGAISIAGLGGDEALASGINDGGDLVGWDNDAGRAFRWTPEAGTIPLPGLDGDTSLAWAINSGRQVVGVSGLYGVLWDADAQVYALDDLLAAPWQDWTVWDARAINDAGWIAASAYSPDYLSRAVLLIPVPEPASLAWMLGIALPLALRRGRGGRR